MDSKSLPLVKRIDWVVTLFLILTPLFTLLLFPFYEASSEVNWRIAIATVITFSICNMSITGGYHRLFAHRSYDTPRWVKAVFLLIGAATFQGSALKWSSDHRRHHRMVDTNDDPYNINRGFWYAHILWLFVKDPEIHRPVNAPDLESDWMFRFQHKYYVWIAIVMCFGVPTLIGWALGSAFGGFLFLGGLRVVLGHHTTFFINSLCHMLGSRPYSEAISARDSIIMAFLTFGEGYHNYHHKFEMDYRNGVRWYQWDPTKWSIYLLHVAGLAKKLKRVPQSQILRARMQMDESKFLASGIPAEKVAVLRERVEDAQRKIRHLYEEYERVKEMIRTQSSQTMAQLREEFKRLKMELKIARNEFRMAVQEWRAQYQLNAAMA